MSCPNFCLISSYVKQPQFKLWGGMMTLDQILAEAKKQRWETLPVEHIERLREKAKSEIQIDGQSLKSHLEHCLHNLVRIAYQARENSQNSAKFPKGAFESQKAAQFGLNIGRAQEILEESPGITGSVHVWWRFFKSEIAQKDFDTLMKKALFRIAELGLEFPTNEFINRE